MPPLQSLQRDFPIIDKNFLHFCDSHGIFSVEDFLVHDLHLLLASAECQASAKDLKKGITEVLSIIDSLHQPWLNGMELLEDAQRNKLVFSTGCEGIDFLLQGGLHGGKLTELVGPSSSGKTQVCLQAASYVALKYMGTVMFLDTSNSFSSKRVAHLVSCLLNPSVKEKMILVGLVKSPEHGFHMYRMGAAANYAVHFSFGVKEKTIMRVMSNILCCSVFDIYMLLDALHQLESKLRSQIKSKVTNMHLLVVDSFSSLVTPVLGGKGSHGHSLMVSAGFLLKKLANEHNLAVLLTNHMVGGEGGISKPALGESWKTVPHVRLLLSHAHESNFYNISILKHTSLGSGQTTSFAIPN